MADKKYKLKFGMSDGTEQSVEFTAPQGDKGDPGITPVVNVSDIDGGHRVTITTDSNVQSFDVMDGKDGEGGGGTADSVAWENVTGKPFKESLTGSAVPNGDTLSWDGNKAAMPIITGNVAMKFAYVSDNVPTMEELGAGFTLTLKTYAGTEMNINIAPVEYENYILIGDMDGSYLYIVKQPFTSGNNAFERAGIYFYAHGSADHYICRLKINGYTFTAMDSIEDAYIPKTIARKSDIPQGGGTVEVDPTLSKEGMAADAKAVGDAINAIGEGGGAQVQPDWNQHDASAPDYVENRVAYPGYSPVLFAEKLWVNDYDWTAFLDPVPAGTYTAPVEGRRYTFGIKDKTYSGTAERGIFDVDGENWPGIRIADDKNGISWVVFTEVMGVQLLYFNFGEPVPVGEGGESYVIIIEGDKLYNKLSVPDDAILSGEGMNIVFEFRNLQENSNRYIAEALINDVEFVIDTDGVESVLTVNDLMIIGDADTIQAGQGVMYYPKGADEPIAMIGDLTGTGEAISVFLIDEQSVTGSGITVKSFKVNLPGIFAPNIPAKKLPAECMPDNVPCSYVITAPVEAFSDMSSTKITLTDNYDDFADILYAGGSVWIDMSAVISAMYGYNAVLRLAVIAWIYVNGAITLTVRNTSTGEGVLEFVFTNGTWTPPTA